MWMLLFSLLTVGAAPAAVGQWTNGLPTDPGYFPIAVWLQSPDQAKRYKDAGINLYVALWKGPTEEQLATLKAAGMQLICEQNRVGLAHRDDPTIVGWMHGDEPDNAQEVTDPKTGKRGYGPCIPPAKIVADYERLRQVDPTRPIMLNLGQGVANDQWNGRGSGASIDDYPKYVKGGDIISFDVYPVAGLGREGVNKLWYVPKGIDRLLKWTEGQRRVWNCIECTHIGDADLKPTPHHVRAEVWMSLIHGSQGLIYFVHQFQPKFDEHALLDDPEMLAAVTKINRQIHELAPVLNSPTVSEGASVVTTSKDAPVDLMVKRHDGATYLFAVGMRNADTRATFTVKDVPDGAAVTVLGEGRSIPVHDGRFEDDFAAYDAHLYQLK